MPAEIDDDLLGSRIRDWIDSCDKNHKSCAFRPFSRQSNREHAMFVDSLPKRLIDLGGDSSLAHLVERRKISDKTVDYIALSYCWGPAANNLTTTKDTLMQRESRIHELDGELPQTLQHAFRLTRLLGIRYLWIDALCIVQDDAEEWEVEAAKMGLIYSNAFLVISAIISSHAGDNLFKDRGVDGIPHRVKGTMLPDNTGKDCTVYARKAIDHEIITSCRTEPHRHWEENISVTFPLLSRAWGFQERLLATRVVHFTPSELVWECQEARWCECGAVESAYYSSKNNMLAAFQECLLSDEKSEAMVRRMWREIVKSYSRRRLTRGEDKLPALSGVARLLANATGDDYVAGLWRSALPFDLLWRCDPSSPLRREKVRKPSWSWTSVDSGISWPLSPKQESTQPLQYISSETYFEEHAEGVKAGEASVQLQGKDPFGRVDSGKITLEARIVPVLAFASNMSVWLGIYGTKWAVMVSGVTASPFWPDIDLSLESLGDAEGKKYCMDNLSSSSFVLISSGFLSPALKFQISHDAQF